MDDWFEMLIGFSLVAVALSVAALFAALAYRMAVAP